MHAVIRIQIRSLNLLLLQSALGNLLVGSVLDKFGIGFLASDLVNSLAEVALDLAALPGRNVGIEKNVNLFESFAPERKVSEWHLKKGVNTCLVSG